MIRYYVDLQFEFKPGQALNQIAKKNKHLKPTKNTVIISYEVVSKSLEQALERLQIRMKDTKTFKYVGYNFIRRKRF